ncbi:hypothetical protein WAI453_002637 [Rhynchosporium graminicola]
MNGWTLRVAEHIAAYKIQSLENFPPAFKLIDPDKSYDEQILNLKLKKMKSHVLSWGVFEGMLRCFIGPGTQKALQVQLASSDMVPNPLADEHRHTLADACLKTVELIIDLYEKMGGGQTSFWAAPAAMSENEQAVRLLKMLAEKSPLVKGRSELFRKSFRKIKEHLPMTVEDYLESCLGFSNFLETAPCDGQDTSKDLSYENGSGALTGCWSWIWFWKNGR